MSKRGSVLVTGAGGVIGAGDRFLELFDQLAARKVIPPLP
jgi:hypothetical protein